MGDVKLRPQLSAILIILLVVSLPLASAVQMAPVITEPENESSNCIERGGTCQDSSTYRCVGTKNGRQDDACCPYDTEWDLGEGLCTPKCIDEDFDGYGLYESLECPTQEVDCDDTDAAVNPGAEEECGDGVDNNCNEQVDEGCVVDEGSGEIELPDDLCKDVPDGSYCATNELINYYERAGSLIYCENGEVAVHEVCPMECSVNDQGTPDWCLPIFPFTSRSGHIITNTPDGHESYAGKRNWDIDCALGDDIGAIMSGVVTLTRDNYDSGYGNRVCVRNPTSRLTVCYNHLDAGSLKVFEGCEIKPGDIVGRCGNSGVSIDLGGGGHHLDVYMVNDAGTPFELPNPSTWRMINVLTPPRCGGGGDCGASPSGSFISPKQGSIVSQYFQVRADVSDPEGLDVVTVTIDDFDRPECKFSVDLKGAQEICPILDVNVGACTEPGEHELGLWVRESCGESRLVDKVKVGVSTAVSCSAEICNGVDDDCDGVADDGVCDYCSKCGAGIINLCDEKECNSLGSCEYVDGLISGSCYPQKHCVEEICNGVDDNCIDGIDEGCDLTDEQRGYVHLDGLMGWGEYYCLYPGQCDPGLQCQGVNQLRKTASMVQNSAPVYAQVRMLVNLLKGNSSELDLAQHTSNAIYQLTGDDSFLGGGCCYSFEDWKGRSCVDLRLDDAKECESNEECQSSHCSWDRIFGKGHCCPQGTDWDEVKQACVVCGVDSEPLSYSYCSDKKEVGCVCDAGEGNCMNDDHCALGTYCTGPYAKMLCCPKGTKYQDGKCVDSAKAECSGLTKNACFSSGEDCCFGFLSCFECGKQLKHNEGICEEDAHCCDRDNGCNPKVDLMCEKGIANDFADRGVCCYPWETQNEFSGYCEVRAPLEDPDDDGYKNGFEVRVWSNPQDPTDTPGKRLMFMDCGTIFEKPKKYFNPFEVVELSQTSTLSAIKLKGAYDAGQSTGALAGIVGGAGSDIEAIGSLVVLIAEGTYYLMELNSFMIDDPHSYWVQQGYYASKPKEDTKSFLQTIGETIDQGIIDWMDGASALGEEFSWYRDECDEVVYIKGFTTGYMEGFVIWQVAMLFVGVGEITAVIKAGVGASKVGRAIVKALEAVEAASKLMKGITDEILLQAKTLIRSLKLAFDVGDTLAHRGFLTLVKHGGSDIVVKISQVGGKEAVETASRMVAKLVDDVGEVGVSRLIRSEAGKQALRHGWPKQANEALVRMLADTSELEVRAMFRGMTKEQFEVAGAKISKFMEVAGPEEVSKYFNKWPNSLLDSAGKQRLEMVSKAPGVRIDLGDGRFIDNAVVLKKGDAGWGWEHMKAQGHDVHIMNDFGLPDSNTAVKNLIDEAAMKGQKTESFISRNGLRQRNIILEKSVNGKKKYLNVVVSEERGAIGSIQTAYPVDYDEASRILSSTDDFLESACFIEGTEVITGSGIKNIEDINGGDYVLSYMENSFDYMQVLNVFEHHERDLVVIDLGGEEIITTNEHPFFVRGEISEVR